MSVRPGIVLVLTLLAAGPSMAQPAPRLESNETNAVESQRGVLFLSVDDFTRPYVRLIFEAFSDEVLRAPDPPAIYFESLDASRFQQKQYLADAREWLTRKYRDTRVDLVMPIGEDALGFLADSHGEPWPGAQVLYLEAGSISVDTRRISPQTGGMLLEDHFSAELSLIKTILPETRRVALLYGASNIELARFGGFSEKVRLAGLEPIEMAAISMDTASAAIARLPAQTVVMILAPTVDARGHAVAPNQACELIASAGIAPTFTLAAHDLGCGALGGLMRDWSVVGQQLGQESLARLKQPSTAVVTVPLAKYTTLAFDDRQLARWNIPERRLPAGAVVRFREPNLWRDRRGLVLTTVGVTLVQALLIAGLVFEHRRRRRAEIDSRRNLVAMAHLDRRAAMGELATSLAHELNQPLNAILQNAGVAQMLLTSAALPASLGEIPEIISDIRKDDIRASEMIRRMRGLLQKHELEGRPVDLNDVALDTVAIVRPDANAREIMLELELQDGVRHILGDHVHLQQVLLNLLMNAMDAVAAVPVERRQIRVRTMQVNGEVRLAVVDRGTGIPMERIAQIFEPFYSTKGEGNGMGMGLAIARNIVEAHAGRMAAENNPGGGATVWFAVPAP